MRNYYFPRRIAEYVTMVQVKDIKDNKITVERDVLFGRDIDVLSTERVKTVARQAREPAKIDIQMMAVSCGFQAEEAYLTIRSRKPHSKFYRIPFLLT